MKLLCGASILCLFQNFVSPVFAEQIRGHVELNYTNLYALDVTGIGRYEQYDFACAVNFGYFLNKAVTVDYDINPHTKLSTVRYTYEGEQINLASMGIKNSYSFIGSGETMNDWHWNHLGVNNVFFTMDKNFKNPQSHLTFFFHAQNPEPGIEGFQCILATTQPEA